MKIDTRLVKNVNGSANRKRLVTALVSMCKSLDAVAIAEGVSTAEESEALTDAGCTLVQGSIVRRHSPLSLRQPTPAVAGVASTMRSRER